MLLVDAVVVCVLVARDAADRLELARGVGVLHVAAQLEHEHPAVAVERDRAGLLDIGIRSARASCGSRAGERNVSVVLRVGAEGREACLVKSASALAGSVAPGPPCSAASAAAAAACVLRLLARLSGLPRGRLCRLLLPVRLDAFRRRAGIRRRRSATRARSPRAAACAYPRPHCAILASKTRSAERGESSCFGA